MHPTLATSIFLHLPAFLFIHPNFHTLSYIFPSSIFSTSHFLNKIFPPCAASSSSMHFFSASPCFIFTLSSLYIHLMGLFFLGHPAFILSSYIHLLHIHFPVSSFLAHYSPSFFSIPPPSTLSTWISHILLYLNFFIILVVPVHLIRLTERTVNNCLFWFQTFFNCPAMGSVTSKFCVYHITAPGQEQRTQIIQTKPA